MTFQETTVVNDHAGGNAARAAVIGGGTTEDNGGGRRRTSLANQSTRGGLRRGILSSDAVKENLALIKAMTAICPKYTGKNYMHWEQTVMEGWAVQLGLDATIRGRDPKPPGNDENDAQLMAWRQRQANAILFFQYALSEAMVARYIIFGRTPEQIFAAIVDDRVQKTTSCSMRLERELERFEQGETPLDVWLSKVEEKQGFLDHEMHGGLSEDKLIYCVRTNIHKKFKPYVEQIWREVEQKERELKRAYMKFGMTDSEATKRAKEANGRTFAWLKQEVLESVRNDYNVKLASKHYYYSGGDDDMFAGFNVIDINEEKKDTNKRRCHICDSSQHLWKSCPNKKDKGCYRCGSEKHSLRECKGQKDNQDDDARRKIPFCTNKACQAPDGNHHSDQCPMKKKATGGNKRGNDDDMGTFGLMEQDLGVF